MYVYFYVLFMYVYFILKQGTMEENSMVQPVYIYLNKKVCMYVKGCAHELLTTLKIKP